MKIFSGNSNIKLAQKIAKDLNIKLSPVEKFMFPDGEQRIKINEEVTGENIILVQSANTPVEHNYMELFFMIDALKRSGAESVTCVVPYFGYQRQDHVFRDGEAVSLEVIIRFLQSLKIDRLISIDMHSVKTPYLFSIPVIHLSAIPIFAEKIKELCKEDKDCILVSPDTGGINRVKKLSELTNLLYVALKKTRDRANGSLTVDEIDHKQLNGKKIAFVIDDMISSGKTIDLAVNNLIDAGIKKVYVFSTHAIFSEEAPNILQNSKAEKIFVTDSVDIPDSKKFPKLEILSISEMIAKTLK